MKAQGAIESSLLRSSTAGTSLGQGATEYLVLLAVVLIVALVSVALLGFFPGMASDAQATQSQMYWSSASPIAIVEWGALNYGGTGDGNLSMMYLRLRNTGAYPVRITAMFGGGSGSSTIYCDTSCDGTAGTKNIADFYYMAPGEEKIYTHNSFGTVYRGGIGVRTYTENGRFTGTSICNAASSQSRGTVMINNFGFNYTEYIDGQQIAKRQIGAKPLMIKCG